MRTFSDNDFIYSVDMMFAYLHDYKHEIEEIIIHNILEILNLPSWGDISENISYSPMDVLKNPNEYKDEYDRIFYADLSYPIIMSFDYYVIDGLHRLTQIYLKQQEKIKVYKFSKELMEKFIIGKRDEFNKVDQMETYQLMSLYKKKLFLMCFFFYYFFFFLISRCSICHHCFR